MILNAFMTSKPSTQSKHAFWTRTGQLDISFTQGT